MSTANWIIKNILRPTCTLGIDDNDAGDNGMNGLGKGQMTYA
jgi:hypothetical protein